MQISDSLKQKAEKCGIALSHYDIDGHLIFADEKTVLTFQPSVLKNKKVWGVNVQLYSLRSEQNWGIGDFGDLATLIE
ncbi:4-alpha-glucanotransferase [Haemophilus aegyptius]|nr:hypothetical protein A9506_01670 [Haemophilus aegyptius]STO62168.1 4-alpha-glucanotransferase [Haemophilus aegyptius]